MMRFIRLTKKVKNLEDGFTKKKGFDSNYSEFLARAWLDGYEVEEESKWIVKDARTAGMYFRGIAGISIEGQFSNSWSQRDGCIKFSNKEKAEAVATLTGGTVEKV